jgi:aryl-alcohol dehydrogenase
MAQDHAFARQNRLGFDANERFVSRKSRLVQVQAAVTRAAHAPMSIERLELDEPRHDEILVRVVATGVCHTDIAMRDQTFPVPQPVVLGHEGAGIVERVGAGVTQVVPGDHVVMSYDSCGHCTMCAEDTPSYCYDFFGRNFASVRGDGSTALSAGGERIHSNFFGQSSFATHALCRERNVVKVPRDLDLALLGPLACGIQTGAGSIINGLNVGVGDSVAVFGTGSVGLSAIMAARVAGAAIIIGVDVNDARLELARELGATHTFNGANTNAAQEILKVTGSGVRFALDATGIPAVIRAAVSSLAHRGTCGIVGSSPLGTEITLDAMAIMTAGRSLRGIVEGESTPSLLIPTLIDLYKQGRFPFDRLLSFYPFDEINAAIEDSERGTVVKAVVRMANAGS